MPKTKTKRIFLMILSWASFFIPVPASYGAVFYYLTLNNNINIPSSTSPRQDQTPIGYLAEQHPDFYKPPQNGQYSTQAVFALPPDGYTFTNWSGDIPSGLESNWKITLTMDRNRTITANFVPTKHLVITTRGYIHSSPLLYDINHDGFKEIIVGDMAGYVYCFDHLGNKLWEYYAGNAFDKTVSPIPEWFNPEVKNNNNLGNITIQSSCAAGDIDGDGRPEIICGVGGFVDSNLAGGKTTGFGPVGQGGVLILNADGTLKLLIRGWDTFDGLGNPIQDGFSDGFYSTPAIADLDSDGRLDFDIGGTDQNIYAFKMENKDTSKDTNGNTVRFFRPPGRDGLWAVPIYEKDDDGDGKFNEDPVGCFSPLTFTHVCNDDRDNLLDEDEFEWPFRTTDTIISSPAIADIDGGGNLDIIIGNDSSGGNPVKSNRKFIPPGGALRVLTKQAEEVGAFPQWIEQVVWSSPCVADLNNDGQKEIFVGTGFVVPDGSGGFKGKGLYAFKSDGTAYLPGKSPYGLFATTNNIIFSSPAVGDINGDGKLEIVAADFSGYLYAWNSSGNILPGFPMLPLQEFATFTGADPHAQIRSSPILVDVDGDGIPEIVIGAGWSIVAVKGDGTLVPQFRYGHTSFTTGTTSVYATPAAADLDNSGKIDLVWVTGKSSDGGSTIDHGEIHIWELGTFNKNANPWPMFKRTGTRTSAYTLQFENPIFEPPVSQVQSGGSLKASVNVYPGTSAITNVFFNIEINGSLKQTAMVDNGTNGDAIPNDGRYTATISLPNPISSIGNMSFTATANNGEQAQLKVDAVFSHIYTFNLVKKYYTDVLDRLPEPGGAEGWTGEIERIVSLGIDVKEGFQALAKFFFNSNEYLLKNKTDQQFVTDLYQTFLDRTPAQTEIDYWVGYLNQGLTWNMLITQFAYSEEFSLYIEGLLGNGTRRPENNLINDLYRGFLGRFPDTAGFNGWLTQMRNAQCSGGQAVGNLTYQVTLGFIGSQEYALRNRDNLGYVEDLYNGILRRGADPAGFVNWLTVLQQGTPREQVLQSFVNSPEFQFRVQEVIDAGCFQ